LTPEASEDEGVVAIDEAECLALLGKGGIGRVAVSIGTVPVMFPVNYAMLERDVVFRTGAGSKLDAALRHAVVAFEVDDVNLQYHEGWSVLVIGTAAEITDETDLARAAQLPLEPWAWGSRHHVVAICPDVVSGRRIVHRLRREAPRPVGARSPAVG
jgi:nitroimidazol reductase NimA-like FMN-containing flavoprotein (pyridoxamine 5'-phosphate oxidase superfamily)